MNQSNIAVIHGLENTDTWRDAAPFPVLHRRTKRNADAPH
jgi:hypothetical protein